MEITIPEGKKIAISHVTDETSHGGTYREVKGDTEGTRNS